MNYKLHCIQQALENIRDLQLLTLKITGDRLHKSMNYSKILRALDMKGLGGIQRFK